MAGALERILRRLGGSDVLDALAERLSGADLATLLLEVMRRRAAATSPAKVMRRYHEDRFTAPPASGFDALRRVEDAAIASLPAGYSMVALAPLVPLATHRALGLIDQNRVITTIRGQEVAADPTNAVALEAASRRMLALREDPRSAARVCLAASQRVVRAQQGKGPAQLAHFSLFGLVTAGRDSGGFAFERAALCEHLEFHARCLSAWGVERITVELSDLTGGACDLVLEAGREALGRFPAVEVVDTPERTRGRGYYDGVALRIVATTSGESFEIADGGFVDWTRKLVASAKERCLISGLGMDRLALLAPGSEAAPGSGSA